MIRGSTYIDDTTRATSRAGGESDVVNSHEDLVADCADGGLQITEHGSNSHAKGWLFAQITMVAALKRPQLAEFSAKRYTAGLLFHPQPRNPHLLKTFPALLITPGNPIHALPVTFPPHPPLRITTPPIPIFHRHHAPPILSANARPRAGSGASNGGNVV